MRKNGQATEDNIWFVSLTFKSLLDAWQDISGINYTLKTPLSTE